MLLAWSAALRVTPAPGTEASFVWSAVDCSSVLGLIRLSASSVLDASRRKKFPEARQGKKRKRERERTESRKGRRRILPTATRLLASAVTTDQLDSTRRSPEKKVASSTGRGRRAKEGQDTECEQMEITAGCDQHNKQTAIGSTGKH